MDLGIFSAHETVYEKTSPGSKQAASPRWRTNPAGGVQKGSSAPIVDVVSYGEQVHARGLNLLNGPGNDLVSATALGGRARSWYFRTTAEPRHLQRARPALQEIALNTPLARKGKRLDRPRGHDSRNRSSLKASRGRRARRLAFGTGRRLRGNGTTTRGRRMPGISIFKDGVVL